MDKRNCTLSLNDFVLLMFAMLAKNSKLNDLKDSNIKIACLPFNYKQIIENILCADNGWKEKFSILIDIDEYFDDHFGWEMNLAYVIGDVLNSLNKKLDYDLVMDRFSVSFTTDEVNDILTKYNNEKLLNTMEHFTNLLTDLIYTRQFQERFYDYSARSVKKMHDLYEMEINDNNIKEKPKCNLMKLLRKK